MKKLKENDVKAGLKYDVTCRFSEGDYHAITEEWRGVDADKAKKALRDYMDVRPDGKCPSLKEMKKALGQYADDHFVLEEHARLKVATRQYARLARFVDKGAAGSLACSYGQDDVRVEAR